MKLLKKQWFTFPIGILLLALLTGTAFGEGYTIGLAMHFMRDDYAINVVNAVEEVAAKYAGSKVVTTDANADPQKQLTDMENLVVQGVDAIIVVPFDEKAIIPAIEKANDKDIPIIAHYDHSRCESAHDSCREW
jgi:ribose transport system substrate-binding protein